MTRAGKPLLRRARADQDVFEAIDHNSLESDDLAFPLIAALEAASRGIRKSPSLGTPRHAHELNVPGLRFWRCRRFPYLVFYVEHVDHIEVWRVLHELRDIPSWLADGDEPPAR